MERLKGKHVDFRLLGVLPTVLGLALLLLGILSPGSVFRFYYPVFGWLAGIAHGLVVFAILRAGPLLHIPLARFFHREILQDVDGFIVFEIEPKATCHRMKFLPDDVGVVFRKDGRIWMRTNDWLLSLEDRMAPAKLVYSRRNGRIRGLLLRIPELEPELSMRPIHLVWNLGISKAMERPVHWAVGVLNTWHGTVGATPGEDGAAEFNPYRPTPASLPGPATSNLQPDPQYPGAWSIPPVPPSARR